MRQSSAMAGVTVGTIAMVFFIIGIFLLVAQNLKNVEDRLASGLRLVVFLEDDCSDKDRKALQDVLSQDGLGRVRFVDRDEAVKRLRDRLGKQAYLLEGLEENPLPDSYEVTFEPKQHKQNHVQALAERMLVMPGVEEVQYGETWLRRFFEFSKAAHGLGWLIGGLILLVAILIVSNTIRLSVYARQDEISVLKLVGAKNSFIKGPFYLEGMILGFLGAFLGIAITYLVFSILLSGRVIAAWLGIEMITLDFISFTQAARAVGAGAVLGLIGTISSVGRYLKKL